MSQVPRRDPIYREDSLVPKPNVARACLRGIVSFASTIRNIYRFRNYPKSIFLLFTNPITSSILEVKKNLKGFFMKTYTIRELSELSGLSASTLRYYEEIGLLKNVTHNGNKRLYTEEHIQRLQAICCFKDTGLPISKMLAFFSYEENLCECIEPIITLIDTHVSDITDEIKKLECNLEHIQHKSRYYHKIKEAIEGGLPWPDWEDC